MKTFVTEFCVTLLKKTSSKLNNGRLMPAFVLAALILAASTACSETIADDRVEEAVYVPAAPDYSDSGMWTIVRNDADGVNADVFYIPSTWEFDWSSSDGTVCHYADPSREDHRANMSIEIDNVAEYMADGNNFYSPYYRHITLDTWATLNEDTISRRYRDVAFVDVRRAFERFIELVLDGFDGSYLPNILDILNVGDYHGIEPWVYSECLRKNFHRRTAAYRNANDK